MLTKQALEEYKQLHLEETGTVLSDEVLANEAINLLTLFNFVYRPIKKAWLEEYGKRQKVDRSKIREMNNICINRKPTILSMGAGIETISAPLFIQKEH